MPESDARSVTGMNTGPGTLSSTLMKRINRTDRLTLGIRTKRLFLIMLKSACRAQAAEEGKNTFPRCLIKVIDIFHCMAVDKH